MTECLKNSSYDTSYTCERLGSIGGVECEKGVEMMQI